MGTLASTGAGGGGPGGGGCCGGACGAVRGGDCPTGGPAEVQADFSDAIPFWGTASRDAAGASAAGSGSAEPEAPAKFEGQGKELPRLDMSRAAEEVADVGQPRGVAWDPPRSFRSEAPSALSEQSEPLDKHFSCQTAMMLTEDPEESPAIARRRERHGRRRLMITHTMGMNPSNALQLVIENSDDIRRHYNLSDKILGSGSFGTVCAAELAATRAWRAVKAIDKKRLKETEFVLKQEIDIMKMIDHPNLLMLHEIFEDASPHQDAEKLYLVLELCTGGTLHAWRKRHPNGCLTERQAATVTQQVLRAVQYLHNHHICHRDLKADNCLLHSDCPIERCQLKVSDFGLSCVLPRGKFLKRVAGTPTHVAPEVIARKYTHSCDVWSCGVMVYQILCGYLPFEGSKLSELHVAIKTGELDFSTAEWLDISQGAIAFICKLLARNPKQRFSARRALKDNWMVRHLPPQEAVHFPDRIIEDLRKFRQRNRVKRAALHVMASMLPEAQTSDVRKAFAALDVDGDGLFSIKELQAQMKVSRSEAMDVFSDEMHDFTYTEFLAATFNRSLHGNESLYQAAFSSFDKNGDGHICLGELATGKMLGKLSVDELKKSMEACDVNGDQQIDYPEFVAMMRRSTKLAADLK